MKHHEIDTVGKFWTQRAVLPAWAAKDEGRIIYDDTNNLLYFGNNSAWRRVTVGDEATFALKAADNNWTATQSPNTDNAIDLGQVAKRWRNVYSATFTGTVTTATYADLAEMYKTPVKYPVGTVVKISENPLYDICMADYMDENVLGVISSKPGFILNFTKDKIENMQPVGLVGRVPIRIFGPIKKGQPIMSNGNGLACAFNGEKPLSKIGCALESNSEDAEKLVECSIK